MHLWNEKPVGWLGIGDGAVMAAAEMFNIRITGKGGHGAVPHLAIDPVLAAAHVITALQSIPARNGAPLKAAVISVTTLRAGEAFNIIPPYAELTGTIRTFEPEVRSLVLERFHQVVNGVAEAMGCKADIHCEGITLAVVNNQQVAERVRKVAEGVLPDCSVTSHFATMGSEDMSYMMQDIPGCFIFVGSANSEKGLDAPHHHPRFDIDEEALPKGAALMAATAAEFLSA
jgi:amidohydrolase